MGIFLFCYHYIILQKIAGKENSPAEFDLLNQVVIEGDGYRFSYWPVSHFIMYLILGFFFPDCWLLLIILGILWEIIEFVFGIFERKFASNKQKKKLTKRLQYASAWWAPQIGDILFNLAGLSIGLVLHRIIYGTIKV